MDLFAILQNNLSPERKLEDAIRNNNLDRLDNLIQNGIDVNAVLLKQGGYTALHIAAQAGNFLVIEKLLSAGANPVVPNDFNLTPLNMAARKQHARAVEVLLRVDPDIRDVEGIWSQLDGSMSLWRDSTDTIMCVWIKATPNMMAARTNVRLNLIHICVGENMVNSLKLWFLAGNTLTPEQQESVDSRMDKPVSDWMKTHKRTVQPLAHYCRLSVRRAMHGNCNAIHGSYLLPLPMVLRDYLYFRWY